MIFNFAHRMSPSAAQPALETASAPTAEPGLAAGAAPRRRIALVGNPNVGKSVIFGALTGTYATVSNYPGTTVEVASAAARFDPGVEIVDTPGVNSLVPNSEDERVTRDILLDGVDLVIQVADAKNLPRALVLSLQLAETGLPFVLVLNMMDEAADRGLEIDVARLSGLLGVPVLPTVAVSGQGLKAVAKSLGAAASSPYRTSYPAELEKAVAGLEQRLSGAAMGGRSLALMCLAGDETLRPWLLKHVRQTSLQVVERAYREFGTKAQGRPGYQISRARLEAAARLARSVTAATQVETEPASGQARWLPLGTLGLAACLLLFLGDWELLPTFSAGLPRAGAWAVLAAIGFMATRNSELRATLGHWASRRGSGLAVLFVVLYAMYRFVGVFAAGTGVDFFESTIFGEYINPVAVRLVEHGVGALAPSSGAGASLGGLVRDMLVGEYGLITVALTYALAIIFPIVTAFFLAFSILEDSGYLPRLAVVVNRAFRGMGLNGKAVLPMVLGLGCDTMATLTARIMETRKERLLVTLLLALGVPCSAQLGVILALFGALPGWAPLVWGGVVLGVLFAVGFLAARLLPGDRSDLILEIPPIRCPQLGNVVVKTVGRLQWYVKEAVPIFILGTFVLFVLDSIGVLGQIIRFAEPVVTGVLGLPEKATEAFLMGFFRRDYGSAGIFALFENGLLTSVQATVALITITLFVPCVANFFVIVKEHGMARAFAMSAFIFPFAFVVGGAVNLALRAIGLS